MYKILNASIDIMISQPNTITTKFSLILPLILSPCGPKFLNFDNMVAKISSFSFYWIAIIANISSLLISAMVLPQFNFFSSLSHHVALHSLTFSQNFSNGITKIHILSSFSQISLNNAHITNKHHFIQYLAKRLYGHTFVIFSILGLWLKRVWEGN